MANTQDIQNWASGQVAPGTTPTDEGDSSDSGDAVEPITILEASVELTTLLDRLEKAIAELPDEDFGDIESQIEDAKKLADALEEKGNEIEAAASEDDGDDSESGEGEPDGDEGGDGSDY